jgi:hypothetical protein
VRNVGDQSTWGPEGCCGPIVLEDPFLEFGTGVPRDQLRQLPVQSDPPTQRPPRRHGSADRYVSAVSLSSVRHTVLPGRLDVTDRSSSVADRGSQAAVAQAWLLSTIAATTASSSASRGP